jgi:meiotic recombination protein SPO11
MTRAFAQIISTSIPGIAVLGLVDFDPYGLDILSIYKYGSVSLAHETGMELATLIWLGLRSHIFRPGFAGDDLENKLLKLTDRDRRKAISMLNKPIFQAEATEENDIHERRWRRELQVMLILNMKAEIQVLGNSEKLVASLTRVHEALMGWLKRRRS